MLVPSSSSSSPASVFWFDSVSDAAGGGSAGPASVLTGFF